MKLAKVRITGTTDASTLVVNRVVEMCVNCPFYERHIIPASTSCKAMNRSLEPEDLPLAGWCPLPDADGFDEEFTGKLEVTMLQMIKQMERLRLMAESVQDYVGASYPGEQDMIRADDSLLMAIVQRLGALVGEAYDLLNIQDATVIFDIMAKDRETEASEDRPSRIRPASSFSHPSDVSKPVGGHLCPKCSQPMDESDYCDNCKESTVVM